MEKSFCSQYTRTEHPMPLSDQLKQLIELHKAAELAMKGLIVWMWPGDPLPHSYFGLVRRLVNALLEIVAEIKKNSTHHQEQSMESSSNQREKSASSYPCRSRAEAFK